MTLTARPSEDFGLPCGVEGKADRHPSHPSMLKTSGVIPAATVNGEPNEVATPTDLIFRALCAIYGIRSQRYIRITIVVLHVTLVAVILVMSCEAFGLPPFSKSEKQRSLSEFANIGSNFFTTATLIFFFGQIAFHVDRWGLLLRTHGRNVKDFAALALWTVPSAIIMIHDIADTCEDSAFWFDVFDKLNYFHFVSWMALSLDIIYQLQKRQADIVSLMDQLGDNCSRIMAEKWALRAQIKKANGFIRVIMVAYEVQFFAWLVFATAYVVEGTGTTFNAMALVLYVVCTHLQLFKIVMEGSNLLQGCLEGEEKLLKLHQDKHVDQVCLQKVLSVVRVSEDWDALQVGFSPMKGSHFGSFLVTSFTCAAVVLQFDHRVVGMLDQLSRAQLA